MLRRFMWPSRCATPKVVRNQDCRRLLWCIERWTNWNFSGFVARRWIVTFRFLGICLIPPPPEKCFGCRTAASNNFMFGDLASNFPYWFIYFLLLAHFLILLIAKILQQFLRLFMPLSLSLYIYISLFIQFAVHLHTASGTEVQVYQQYRQCNRNEVDFVVAVGNFFSPNEQIGRLGLYVGREGRKMPVPVYFIDNTSVSWH